MPVTMVIKGDYKCASIAAASVVAKVERDELMVALDRVYPGYGWAKNKGYGSAAHREAISAQGPSPMPVLVAAGHRRADSGRAAGPCIRGEEPRTLGGGSTAEGPEY